MSAFGYENKEKYSICVSKNYCKDKQVDLLFIVVEGGKALCSSKRF